MNNVEPSLWATIPFKAVAETLDELTQDKKYLGATIGFTAILHTWGKISCIIRIDDAKISFRWRGYSDNSKSTIMTLSAEECIRRFLIHVLPTGFMQIRRYGFLGKGNKKMKLKICKRLTNTPLKSFIAKTTLDLITEIIGKDPRLCSACGSTQFGYFGTSKPSIL